MSQQQENNNQVANDNLIAKAVDSVPATSLEAGADWHPTTMSSEMPVPFSQYRPGMYPPAPTGYLQVYRPHKLWSKYIFMISAGWLVLSIILSSVLGAALYSNGNLVGVLVGSIMMNLIAFAAMLTSLMFWRTRADSEYNTKKKWHSGH